MPELPDVEVFAGWVRNRGLGRRVDRVEVRDPGRLRGTSPQGLGRALHGRVFEAVKRHGKVLFLHIGGTDRELVMHFGMTGFVAFCDEPAGEPAHARLVIAFEDGGRFAFDNQRRFGWVEVADDIDAYLRAEGIGPDALDLDSNALRDLLAGRRGMVKPALMDQAHIAGIGNVYSDEILFQARIRPDREAGALGPADIDALHERMGAVLREAVDAGADPARMPDEWLTPHRGTDDPCPRCGGRLETRRVSGRTAWLCPACQG